tara:strand:- start:2447 stop:3298 length:852 start_codon:yes stop_codon:yes gene_type:complete
MSDKITKHIITLILITNIVYGQFQNIETHIDLRQIRENDRFYFENLDNEIYNFFTLNNFGADLDYLELNSNIHIIIESIIDKNGQKIINGQIIITNRSDIMMPLKSFSFPISQIENISYNPNLFNPLSSLLEFSAHILIANEIDTYESKGGNEHFNIALAISQIGKESDYSKGWNDRWQKCKQIQENFFLRDMKYFYFLADESLYQQDIESLKIYINSFHNAVKLNSEFIGMDNNTINFFRAFAKNLVVFYSELSFKEGLIFLSEYDIDNKSLYKNALNNLNQ